MDRHGVPQVMHSPAMGDALWGKLQLMSNDPATVKNSKLRDTFVRTPTFPHPVKFQVKMMFGSTPLNLSPIIPAGELGVIVQYAADAKTGVIRQTFDVGPAAIPATDRFLNTIFEGVNITIDLVSALSNPNGTYVLCEVVPLYDASTIERIGGYPGIRFFSTSDGSPVSINANPLRSQFIVTNTMTTQDAWIHYGNPADGFPNTIFVPRVTAGVPGVFQGPIGGYNGAVFVVPTGAPAQGSIQIVEGVYDL